MILERILRILTLKGLVRRSVSFSGPRTPQSNGKVERKFQRLY
jgi:hypothetical protein